MRYSWGSSPCHCGRSTIYRRTAEESSMMTRKKIGLHPVGSANFQTVDLQYLLVVFGNTRTIVSSTITPVTLSVARDIAKSHQQYLLRSRTVAATSRFSPRIKEWVSSLTLVLNPLRLADRIRSLCLAATDSGREVAHMRTVFWWPCWQGPVPT